MCYEGPSVEIKLLQE